MARRETERWDWGGLRRLEPVSREFGYDRGLPIDRYYIERFLETHRCDVTGRTLEIGDDEYTRRYGGGRATRRDVLHVHARNPAATIVGDLIHAPQMADEIFDCIILTQTLGPDLRRRPRRRHAPPDPASGRGCPRNLARHQPALARRVEPHLVVGARLAARRPALRLPFRPAQRHRRGLRQLARRRRVPPGARDGRARPPPSSTAASRAVSCSSRSGRSGDGDRAAGRVRRGNCSPGHGHGRWCSSTTASANGASTPGA